MAKRNLARVAYYLVASVANFGILVLVASLAGSLVGYVAWFAGSFLAGWYYGTILDLHIAWRQVRAHRGREQ